LDVYLIGLTVLGIPTLLIDPWVGCFGLFQYTLSFNDFFFLFSFSNNHSTDKILFFIFSEMGKMGFGFRVSAKFWLNHLMDDCHSC
jgi:hypothetical protein